MSFMKPIVLAVLADTSVSTFETSIEENLDPGKVSGVGLNSGSTNLVWYFISFIVILLLAAWGIRWMAGKMGRIGGRHLKLLESLHMGPNRGVHLIKVANRVFLIGLADRYLELLAEIDDPEIMAEVQHETSATSQSGGLPNYKDFSHYLQKVLTGKKNTEENLSPSRSSKNRLEDELKKFKDFRDNARTREGEEDV